MNFNTYLQQCLRLFSLYLNVCIWDTSKLKALGNFEFHACGTTAVGVFSLHNTYSCITIFGNWICTTVCQMGCYFLNSPNITFKNIFSMLLFAGHIGPESPAQKNSWNQINQFHEIIFDQIPFFAISKMAKNQFLNWEKV